jgi:pimeloyl-ACP methyl ester carboxylesterase
VRYAGRAGEPRRSRLAVDRLPVIRIRATGDNPTEPIFRLTGGPGQTNIKFSLVPWFIEDHDIVLVGYRGVDGSVVLGCPEVGQVMKNPSGDMLSDPALDNLNAAYARCAGRLQAEGVDTDGYTVTEVVDDMEAARVGLGYERINLLSGSYGTRVAMIYTWMYPESIYRSAMIAVDAPRATVHEPEVVDEQIEYYADLCAQDAECSARTDDLAETIRTVSHNMPERWLFLPINAGLVRVATFQRPESTEEAPVIIDVWLATAEGDPSGMALLTLIGPRIFASAAVWGGNAAKRTSLGEYDPARNYRAELSPPDSIIGSPGTIVAAESAGWPANLIPEEYRQVQPSDVETLLVSGSIDFNTPVQFATDVLLPSLSNGQHVILSESGHGEVGLQPEAFKRLLTSFYDTGVADDSLFTYQPVDFHVRLGYPAQAKLGLAAIVLVIVGVVALVYFVVRRVRRRRASQVSS